MDVNLRQRNNHVGTRSALVRSDDTRMPRVDEIYEHTHRTKHHGRTAPCRCRTNSSGSPPTYDTREFLFANNQSMALLDKHRNLRFYVRRHKDYKGQPDKNDLLGSLCRTYVTLLKTIVSQVPSREKRSTTNVR